MMEERKSIRRDGLVLAAADVLDERRDGRAREWVLEGAQLVQHAALEGRVGGGWWETEEWADWSCLKTNKTLIGALLHQFVTSHVKISGREKISLSKTSANAWLRFTGGHEKYGLGFREAHNSPLRPSSSVRRRCLIKRF